MAAARIIVEERYPHCLAALLAGSGVRGEATATCDLDVVIVTRSADAPFRESFVAHGWPVEAFVHTRDSLTTFFKTDAERRRPSLPTMCAEGVVIKDNGSAQTIKQEAEALLEAGPTPLTETELRQARYTLSDLLNDFVGATNHLEASFVLAQLLPTLCDFIFDTRGEWRGGSKWSPRKLAKLDPHLLGRLEAGLEAFAKYEERGAFVALADEVLEPFGGRLFDGFSLGKNPPKMTKASRLTR